MSPYRGYFEGGSSPPHGGSDNEQENESDDVQVEHEGETDIRSFCFLSVGRKDFEYQPLTGPSNIRLILLVGGNTNQPIYCRLVEANLDMLPFYRALSYEWVPPTEDWRVEERTIYVNEMQVTVLRNLYNALLSLRETGGQQYLWIDALSINQHDRNEKTHQVGIMGKIYSQAHEVVVWLGAAGQHGYLALSYIEELANRDIHVGMLHSDSQGVKAFARLCYRSYWRRMWIIQEIQLARKLTILCGSRWIYWETLSCAITSIKLGTNFEGHRLRILSSCAASLDSHRNRRDHTDLKDWLYAFSSSLCMNPRDKVFSLLAIGRDCPDRIAADYSKSLSQVFKLVLLLYTSYSKLFSLTRFLQRALGTPQEAISLTAVDSEAIWVCSMFSGSIGQSNLYDPPKPKEISSDALLPGDYHSVAIKNSEPFGFTDIEGVWHNLETNLSSDKSWELPRDKQLRFAVMDGRQGFGGAWGYASTLAMEGDLLFSFPDSKIALIIRKDVDAWKLIGRALMSEEYSSGLINKTKWIVDPGGTSSATLQLGGAVYLRLTCVALQRLSAD
jgi:hypothetical protein